MSDEKNGFENVEEDSYAELDSLSDFVEIDDLTALEGMEEFVDVSDLEKAGEFTDLSDMGDLGIDLSDEIPLPETDDLSDEIPLPENDDVQDGISSPETSDLSDEISLAEPGDAADEIPLPETNDLSDEISLAEPGDAGDGIPLPETSDLSDEISLQEPEMVLDDASLPHIDDVSEEASLPETDNGGEETADQETSSSLDDMLDGLLDNLDMTGSIPGGPDVADGSEEPEATDLFGLLEDEAPADLEDVMEIGLPEAEAASEQPEEQPGLFKKLFGNIVTDEIAEAERRAMEEEKEVAAEKAELDAKRKEEKAAEKAAKAEQRAAAKAERKAAKQERKEAKAEKKAQKAAKAAEEEQFEVTGKLNKAGVAIIAILTVAFLTVEIVGTNIHSVNRTRREANSYFELGKYTEAYEEILGTNLQEKDPDTYNKIKTVMQVQRSINAYQNYNEMNYYPEALNALLRGIQRYDANLETAKELDVVSDMDTCRAQILQLLQSEFGISESEAYALLALEQEQYTAQVVQTAMSQH